ncbi:PREDICTED: serine protease inhibitor dipetalogastin-like [Nicrophorus vespilloides]|uniref:Serine protease inhibitor dipetalogastin-like n=1 Tax=Nicrophorus vespilloides TaxID=110193 RepID=A0ABM1MG04_NICVS|nr:PREDICTED: serine protease inhibitor dipetalogastin-like [Nicrophorus vespilloides]
MKFVLIVALVAAIGAPIESSPICPAIYQPICASNGKTYDNECLFNHALDEEDSTLTIKFHGTCEYSDWDEIVCDAEDKRFAFCGSDGITYNNKCFFDIAVKRNPSLRKRNGYPCFTGEVTEVICGTDGKFYDLPTFRALQSVRPYLGHWGLDNCRPSPLPPGPPDQEIRYRPVQSLYESPTVCGSDLLIYEIRTFWDQKELRPELEELPLSNCYYKPYFQE